MQQTQLLHNYCVHYAHLLLITSYLFTVCAANYNTNTYFSIQYIEKRSADICISYVVALNVFTIYPPEAPLLSMSAHTWRAPPQAS